jgi:hypothetical protein
LSIVDHAAAAAAVPPAGVFALSFLGFFCSRLERCWPLAMVLFLVRGGRLRENAIELLAGGGAKNIR